MTTESVHSRWPMLEELERRLLLTASPAGGSLYSTSSSLISPVWFQSVSLGNATPSASGASVSAQPGGEAQSGADAVTDPAGQSQWIVQLTADALANIGSVQETISLFAGAPFALEQVSGLGLAGQLLVDVDGSTADAIAAWFRGSSSVAFAEPDGAVSLQATPNDPSYSQLWGLNNTGQTGGTADADIDAPEAWNITHGDGSVVVGVIDTGVDYTHPDLAANMWTNPGEIPGNVIDDDGNGFVDDVHGYDFVNNDGNPMDDHYHGTHVSGTIAGVGDNGAGVVGVNWNAQIMALKFLDATGYGDTANAIRAVNYATMMRSRGVNIRLTSNSWGGGAFSHALQDAIAASGDAGMLFVAAAGNDYSNNDTTPSYPSSYPLDNIIAVAATDANDAKASFSNYGATSVDLGAPGVGIYSTKPGNNYGSYGGTSMATPHVAGVAALAWSVQPNASWQDVRTVILEGVDPLATLLGKCVSNGRLNAAGTLTLATQSKLRFNRFTVDDASGDSSGYANPGESVGLLVRLFNQGLVDAGNITATLSLAQADPDVTILQPTATSGQILARGQQDLGQAFRVQLSSQISSPKEVRFNLSMQDGAGQVWADSFSLWVYSRCQISGSAALDGSPLGGATIQYSGTVSGSVQTDPSGNFVLTVPDGDYQLTAATEGGVPTAPVSVTLSSGQPTQAGVNFTFTTGTVSGLLTDAETGQPLAGAQVSYSGAISGVIATDAQGRYTLTRAFGRTVDLTLVASDMPDYINSSPGTVSMPGEAVKDFALAVFRGYEIIDLTVPGIHPGASAINNRGQILCSSQIPGPVYSYFHSWLWDDGVVTDLGNYYNMDVSAVGLNDSGQVVLNVTFTDGVQSRPHMVLWSNGVGTDINPPGWAGGIAVAINNAGTITGYHGESGVNYSFVYDGSRFTRLTNPAVTGENYPRDINDLGQIVGNASGNPYLWQDGIMTLLLNGVGSPSAINNQQQVLFYNGLWQDGVYTPIQTLTGLNFNTSGINNLGQIVGMTGYSPSYTGELWANGQIYYLANMIRPNSGFTGILPDDINDRGEIIASAQYGGETHAILLRPSSRMDQPPVALGQNVEVNDAPVTITLQGNDVEGQAISYAIVAPPAHGTISGNDGDAQVTYTPQAGYVGSDSFTYRISDATGQSVPATVKISVYGPNAAPSANPDDETTIEGYPIQLNPLLNDTDADGNALSVVALTQPHHASLDFLSGGWVRYTPDADFTGVDSFNYTASDGHGGRATQVVTIHVSPVNDAPVAQDAGVTLDTAQATSLTITMPAYDVDGDALQFFLVDGPANGTLNGLNGGPTVTYAPDPARLGIRDQFTFKVSDGQSFSGIATVRIRVLAQRYEVVNLGFMLNPQDHLSGAAQDGGQEEHPAGAYVSGVLPLDINDAGQITGVQYRSVPSGAGYNDYSDGYLWQNGQMTYLGTLGGDNSTGYGINESGQIVGAADTSENYWWFNSFPFLWQDGTMQGLGVPRGEAMSINDRGQIVGTYNYDSGGFNRVFLYENGAARDLTEFGAGVWIKPVAINNLSQMIGTRGDVSSSFLWQDGVATNLPRSRTGDVVKVTGLNDLGQICGSYWAEAKSWPVVFDDGQWVELDRRGLWAIPGWADTSLNVVRDINNLGQMVGQIDPGHISDDGSMYNSYVPVLWDGDRVYNLNDVVGNDAPLMGMAYAINDRGQIAAYGNYAYLLTPIPTAGNAPPAVGADAYTASRNMPAATGNVLANDSDSDADPLRVADFTQPQHGQVRYNRDGTFSYTPDTDYSGPDGFTYTVTDGQFHYVTGNVSIDVQPNDAPPAATDVSATTGQGAAVTIALHGRDPDPQDSLQFVLVDPPSHGVLSAPAAEGQIIYTPNVGYSGQDSFTFRVYDGQLYSNVAICRIVVNDPPVARGDLAQTAQGQGTVLNLLANDTDANGQTLSVVLDSQPLHGQAVVNPDNTVTYAPNADFSGADSFTYRAWDGFTLSAEAAANITVTAAPDHRPVASNQNITIAEDTPQKTINLSATDPDGDSLTYRVVTPPGHGTYVLNDGGILIYAPARDFWGTDSIIYVANDGATDSAPATITVIVTAVNDAPVADPPDFYTPPATSVTVPLSATDVDSTTLTYTVLTHPAYGSLVFGTNFCVYTPTASFRGTDSFTYKANDGLLDSNIATATIDVQDVPPARAVNVSAAINDGAYTIGAALPITVTFSSAVTVTGAPTLTLETGDIDAVATYVGGSGATVLTFQYTVAAGQNAPDLDYAGEHALVLNGGTIRGASNIDAKLRLPAPGTAGSLGANKYIDIDTISPTAVSIALLTAAQTNASASLFAVTFSEAVFGLDAGAFVAATTGTIASPQVAVSGAGASYVVTVSVVVGDGTVRLDLRDDDRIHDAAGNELSGHGAGNGDVQGPTVTVDQTPPSLLDWILVKDTGSSASDKVTWDTTPTLNFTFSEAVWGQDSDVTVLDPAGLPAVPDSMTGWGADTLSIVFSTPLAVDGQYSVVFNSGGTIADHVGNLFNAGAEHLEHFTLTTALSEPPDAPDLLAASDTGASATDRITNDTTPSFEVTIPLPFFRVYADGVLISGLCDADAPFTAPAQAEGIHRYTISAVSLAGEESPQSGPLTVTIDTTAPTGTVPDLNAASDTGVSSTDNITQGISPAFDGTASDPTSSGVASGIWKVEFNSDDGKHATDIDSLLYSVVLPTLKEGARSVTATVYDVAGNSSTTAALALTVDRDAGYHFGSLDKTFGGTGMLTTAFSDNSPYLSAIQLQPDDKILAAGGGLNFLLVRYNCDGSLDSTFGVGGKVSTDFGSDSERASAMALQPDGKIVLAGSVFRGTYGTQYDVALARYNPDGTLDSAFGSGGTVVIAVSSYRDEASAVVVQPDGRILVAGSVDTTGGGNSEVLVMRFNIDGSLDATFGTGGKVTTAISSYNYGKTMVLQPDGQIVVGGQYGNANTFFYDLLRYNPDGSSDQTFGSYGTAVLPMGSSYAPVSTPPAAAVALQGDGKIVLGGATWVSSRISDMSVSRVNKDGSIDTTFGTNGVVRTHIAPIDDGSQIYGIAIQPDGRIVTVGDAYYGQSVITRYNANGTLDTTFGSGGLAYQGVTSADNPRAIAIQPDGKIVMGGYAPQYLILARFGAAPQPPLVLQAASDTGYYDFDNITSDTTPTFTVPTVPEYYRIYCDGTLLSDSYQTGASFTAPVQPEGLHSFAAVAVDAAGNETAATPLPVRIDTTAPWGSVPDLNASSDTGQSDDDNITQGNNPVFDGTAGDTISGGYASGIWKVVVTSNDSKTGADSTSPFYSVTLGTLSEGLRTLTATIIDMAGNSWTSGALTVLVDRTLPTASIPDLNAASDTGQSSTDNITMGTNAQFDGTASDPASAYASGIWKVVVSADDGSLGSDASSPFYSATIPPISDGTRTVKATAYDIAGNSYVTSTLTIRVDHTPPTPTVPDLLAAGDTGASSTDNITNSTNTQFTGSATDPAAGGYASGVWKIVVASDDGKNATSTSSSYTSTLSPLAEGNRSVTATAYDIAGNSAPAVLQVGIDRTAPTATVPDLDPASDTGVSDTDNITQGVNPQFDGTATDLPGGGYASGIWKVTLNSDDGKAATDSVSSSYGIVLATLGEGPRAVSATAYDLAGNSSTSGTFAALVDRTAPTATVNALKIKNGSPTLTGTVSDASPAGGIAGVSVLVNGQSLTATLGGGTWSTGVPIAIPDGTYDVQATATDLAGNAASDVTTDELTVYGATGPTVDPLPAATAGTSRTVNWSAVPWADRYWAEYDDDPAFGSPEGNSGWITGTSYTFTGLVDGGTYYYRVRPGACIPEGTGSWAQSSQADFQGDALTNAVSTASGGGDVELSTLAVDTIGGMASSGAASAAMRVNFFQCIASKTLTQIQQYLNIPSSTSLAFTVYEGTTQTGYYNRIFARTLVSGTGAGWYSSGTIAVTLVAGRYYAIGVASQGSATYYYDAGNQSPSWGTEFGGGTATYPPASRMSGTVNSLTFYQKLTASSGAGPVSGTAVSPAITPATVYEWNALAFNATTPANTTLTVDVLDGAGTLLAADVDSGTDLASLGITGPAIKLRANLATTTASITPALLDWTVGWTVTPETTDPGSWSNVVHSTQDATSPAVAVNPLITTNSSPLLTGTVDDPQASIQVTVAGNACTATNNGDGTWTLAADVIIPGLKAGTYDVAVVATDVAGNVGQDASSNELRVNSNIADRRVFYNRSTWDWDAGGDSNHNSRYDPGEDGGNDDAAIASDKVALLPGSKAAFVNYTSFSRGINGIMIDIAGLPSLPGTLSAGDFIFKVGNSNDPSTWANAPTPQTITIRPGAGVDGSDRVVLTWADNAIAKKWLQVTVKSDANSGHAGLAGDDVFYFGNAIGECGNSLADALVNATDQLGPRDNPHGPANLAPIDDRYDYNRDRLVDALDMAVAKANQTSPLTALRLIAVPASKIQSSGMSQSSPAAGTVPSLAIRAPGVTSSAFPTTVTLPSSLVTPVAKTVVAPTLPAAPGYAPQAATSGPQLPSVANAVTQPAVSLSATSLKAALDTLLTDVLATVLPMQLAR